MATAVSPNSFHPDARPVNAGKVKAMSGVPQGAAYGVAVVSAFPSGIVHGGMATSDDDVAIPVVNADISSASVSSVSCSSLRKDGNPCKGRALENGRCYSHL